MLFGHETSFIMRYQYVDKMNRIRILFSIDLDDQNQVPYGPKHGLYRKTYVKHCFVMKHHFRAPIDTRVVPSESENHFLSF